MAAIAADKSCHKGQRTPGVHLEEKRGTVEVRQIRGDRVRVRTNGNSEAGVHC